MDNKNKIFKVHYAKSFEHLQTVTNMIQTHSSSSVRPFKLQLAKAVKRKALHGNAHLVSSFVASISVRGHTYIHRETTAIKYSLNSLFLVQNVLLFKSGHRFVCATSYGVTPRPQRYSVSLSDCNVTL